MIRPNLHQLQRLSSLNRQFHNTNQLSKKIEWMALVLENREIDRLPLRPHHLSDVKVNYENGTITHGGALFVEPPAEGEKPKFAGSILHVMAETREEVKQILKNDVYHKGGAWDTDNAIIYPCAIAISTPRNVFAKKEEKKN